MSNAMPNAILSTGRIEQLHADEPYGRYGYYGAAARGIDSDASAKHEHEHEYEHDEHGHEREYEHEHEHEHEHDHVPLPLYASERRRSSRHSSPPSDSDSELFQAQEYNPEPPLVQQPRRFDDRQYHSQRQHPEHVALWLPLSQTNPTGRSRDHSEEASARRRRPRPGHSGHSGPSGSQRRERDAEQIQQTALSPSLRDWMKAGDRLFAPRNRR